MMDPMKIAKETKRNRKIALCQVAKKVCDLLDAEGVRQEEGCSVRRMAEDMWQDNYNLNVSNCGEQPTVAVDGGC